MNDKKIIIGVVGLFSAGKDTMAEYLQKYDFIHHSLSDIIRDILKEKNIKETIPNLANMGNEIRTKYGPGELAKRSLEKINKTKKSKFVVSSIRHTSEITELKKDSNFILVAIDAPIELRYQRLTKRGKLSDDMTFEKFKTEEEKQLTGSGAQMELLNCIKMADYAIDNTGNLNDLHKKIDILINKIT